MQERLLEYVDRIASVLAKNMKFGIYDEDDIKQEIFLLVHKAEPLYDPSKGDEFMFYYHFVRNRLRTLRRDKYQNPTLTDKDLIVKFNNPIPLEENTKSYYNQGIEEVDKNDLLSTFVNSKIPAALRIDYLKILEGIDIPYHDRVRVIKAVKNILENK